MNVEHDVCRMDVLYIHHVYYFERVLSRILSGFRVCWSLLLD